MSVQTPERHQAEQLEGNLGEAYHGYVSVEERLEAIRRLESMSLPVGEPDEMKRESVPDPGNLLA